MRPVRFLRVAAIVAAVAIAPSLLADAVTTQSGKRVEGDIIYQDKRRVVLRTKEFGELHFQIINLKSIERSASSAPITEGPTGPTIGSTASATQKPMTAPPSGIENDNPFGGDRAGAPAAGGGANNFGGNPGAGFAPPSGGQPPMGGAPAERGPGVRTGLLGLLRDVRDLDGGSTKSIGGLVSGMGMAMPAMPFGGASMASAPPPSGAPPMSGGLEKEDPKAAAAAGIEVPTLADMPKRQLEPPPIRPGYDAALFDINPPDKPVRIYTPESGDRYVEELNARLLQAKTVVETVQSRVQLQVRQKRDSLRIPERSKIRIDRLSPDAEQVEVHVLSGSLWSEVSPRSNPGDFKITTPDLTAGVRGTKFRVEVVTGKGSLVIVDEGVVEVRSNRAPVSQEVGANQAVLVKVSGQITDILRTDPFEAQKGWDSWAEDASLTIASGNAAAASLISPVFKQIADDNAKWDIAMRENMQNVAKIKYQDEMQKVAQAFMRFAEDTGYVPNDDEAWNLLKENRRSLPGWNGPYIEGPVPPIDPFNQVLIYRKRLPQNGNVYATIYSIWSDRTDNNGMPDNDLPVLAKFFEVDAVRRNPEYAPAFEGQ